MNANPCYSCGPKWEGLFNCGHEDSQIPDGTSPNTCGTEYALCVDAGGDGCDYGDRAPLAPPFDAIPLCGDPYEEWGGMAEYWNASLCTTYTGEPINQASCSTAELEFLESYGFCACNNQYDATIYGTCGAVNPDDGSVAEAGQGTCCLYQGYTCWVDGRPPV